MPFRGDIHALAAERHHCPANAQPSREVRPVNAARPPGDAGAVGIPVDNSLCRRFGVKIPHQFFTQQSTGDAAMWIARRVLSFARAEAGRPRETRPERSAMVEDCRSSALRRRSDTTWPVTPSELRIETGAPAWFWPFCPHIQYYGWWVARAPDEALGQAPRHPG